MTLADLKIQRVMCRRDLQDSGSKLRIDCFVGNDGNFLACEWPPGMFA